MLNLVVVDGLRRVWSRRQIADDNAGWALPAKTTILFMEVEDDRIIRELNGCPE